LRALAVQEGKPLTHKRLLQTVWGPDHAEETEAAHEVDLRQSVYDEARGFQAPRISETRPGRAADDQPKERILIHITADPAAAMLIRRGRRVADYLHADCTALFVHRTAELSQLPRRRTRSR